MSTSEPQFDGSVHVVYDHDAHNALLVDPGTPVEVRCRGRRRGLALARVGLSVVAISGLCLVPATSLAEDVPASPPAIVVTADCTITAALDQDAPKSELPDGTAGPAFEKGTPSGVLDDGRLCVQPPADPAPAEPPAPAPAEPAAPAEAPAAEATADAPAAPVEAPAAEPAPQAQVEAPASTPAPTHAPLHTMHSA